MSCLENVLKKEAERGNDTWFLPAVTPPTTGPPPVWTVFPNTSLSLSLSLSTSALSQSRVPVSKKGEERSCVREEEKEEVDVFKANAVRRGGGGGGGGRSRWRR